MNAKVFSTEDGAERKRVENLQAHLIEVLIILFKALQTEGEVFCCQARLVVAA